MATCRYVYKTLHEILINKHPVNFQSLRNKLVTLKANEARIRSWEITTAKEVRAGAVDQVVLPAKQPSQT